MTAEVRRGAIKHEEAQILKMEEEKAKGCLWGPSLLAQVPRKWRAICRVVSAAPGVSWAQRSVLFISVFTEPDTEKALDKCLVNNK